MINQGIKNLIFDFGEILVNLNRQRCIDNFKALGLETIDKLIDPFAQQGIFTLLEKGVISSSEFREKIRETTNSNSLSDQQIDNAWNSFLDDIPSYKLDALLELRKRYSVYLLSNTNEIHWNWSVENLFPYKEFQVNDYFNKIFLSYEMHFVKPEPEIYQTVINTTGIKPEETLFIDDLEANCLAAAALGIKIYNAKPGEDWRFLFGNF